MTHRVKPAYISMFTDGTLYVTADKAPGALCVAMGLAPRLHSILLANTDKEEEGHYVLSLVADEKDMPSKYVASQIWTAKVAKTYASDKTVMFFVNRSSNATVRRVAARAINEVIN